MKKLHEILNECVFDKSIENDRSSVCTNVAIEAMKRYSKELEEENKAYTNNQYPIRAKDLKGNEEDFSVDVITLSEQNMLNIGYWNYDMKKWLFHTDTLSDPYEGGELENFIWMYKPKYLK